MSAGPHSPVGVIDLDDADGLLSADRDGLLRAAAMAGAQVRATGAALAEGVLDPLGSELPARTVIWVAGRGTAATAGTLLAATLGASVAAPIVVVSEVPPWIGALDVLVVAGDDPMDPMLVSAAATGVRRGARVLVAAPYEGPLRDATAGRAVALPPRVPVPDDFAMVRYLAVGLALMQVIDRGVHVDLAALADELDDEALRDSAGREMFTNPAKNVAERMTDRDVIVAADDAAMLALAHHAAAVLLRVGQERVTTVSLSDALVALRRGLAASGDGWGMPGGYRAERSLFHDEQIDGPLPARIRILVLAGDAERSAIAGQVSGYDDVDVITADDVPDGPGPQAGRRPEQQIATMAVRLETAAVYRRLVRG
jgi:hypothetical protein